MKKNIYILSIAALALVGAMMAGCSKEETTTNVPQPEITNDTVTLTTTLSLDCVTATRSLASDGKKTFAVGETIAVIYKNSNSETIKAVSNALTAEDISNNGRSAVFTVTMTAPKSSGTIRYIYPASMAKATIETSAATNDDDATINFNALAKQDGTLASLSSLLDLAVFDGSLTQASKLPTYVSLANRLAVCQFSVNAASDITSSVTGLYVGNGTNKYYISRTPAEGPIYVAMLPVTTGDIEFGATTGSVYYEKTVSGETLAANNLYPITVTMTRNATVNLAKIASAYVVQNGETLTGELNTVICPVKISIAYNATVTLNNVTINGVDNSSCNWAGISCEGPATIILKDGSTNIVRGFISGQAGIQAPDKDWGTLTIQGEAAGTGSLTASSNYYGAGIGASINRYCGNIVIEGGIITAIGGECSAGIGGALASNCGYITITGGTINATGGESAAGIGSGENVACGNITIANTVTSVRATKGSGAQLSIGAGQSGSCGTVTIGGTEYWNGTAYINGGDEYLPTSPLVYIPPAAFSVSGTLKVYFSPGNLQCIPNTRAWRFAENQWGYIGVGGPSEPGNAHRMWEGDSYTDWYDIFGWGTWTGSSPNPAKADNYDTSYAWGDGDFTEESLLANAPLPGKNWRTLSQTEWAYLFNTRETTSGVRYAKATVNSVEGVILLPDNWSTSYHSLASTNTADAAYTANEISSADWNTDFEAHGAIFLPVATIHYYGYGPELHHTGNYWSTTPYSETKAYCVNFSSSTLSASYTHDRSTAISVRLVYND